MVSITLEDRRSGKTTGALLRSLGEAIANPETSIIYWDHAAVRTYSNPLQRHCLSILKKMISDLRLKEIEVSILESGAISILNKFKGVYQGSDNFIYKRIN